MHTINIKYISKLFIKKRKKDGLSMRQAAKRTGIGYATISRLERGKMFDIITFNRMVRYIKK